MPRPSSAHFWLALMAALQLTAGQAADPTNLVEILRAAMGPGDLPSSPTNQVLALAPGDVLKLTVYQEENLDLPRAVIDREGTISHPLLGPLAVGGKTLREAERFIHDVLEKDYLVNPRISLSVEYARYRLTIRKEVVRQDITYEVPRDRSLTLLQALALAGGPTRQANTSKVRVQRGEGALMKEFILDLEVKAGREFVVQPGDVIEVPTRGR